MSLLSFKKFFIQTLGDYKDLAEKISGVFLGSIQDINLPLVKFGDLIIEDWSSSLSNGKVFNITLEVFSKDPSSKECTEIMDILEAYIPTLKNISDDFIISKIKILLSKISFIKAERIWCGEIKVKFWIENIH